MAETDQQHRNSAEDPQDKNPHGASADSMESSGEKNTEQKGNSAKMESASYGFHFYGLHRLF